MLFVTAETTKHADAIGNYLVSGRGAPFRSGEVLIIHTDSRGEITKKDLDLARDAARDIDNPDSTVKAIVSVMMLKEGWDVRNVTVVLGLRPFSAKAEILPEQVIGRGLRIMRGVGPERTQTLEVLGTRNLLKVLKEQLEQEGVGVAVTKTPPPQPVWIEPTVERRGFDIAIPLTRPTLHHEVRKLQELKAAILNPIYSEDDLAEPWQIRLRAEFATPGVDLGTLPFDAGELPAVQDLVGDITRRTIEQAHLTAAFANLYPIVRDYLTARCFGREVDLDDKVIRSRLREPLIREGIAKYLARSIGKLTVERREMEFERRAFRLSQTRAFPWRRDLPPLVCAKTVFNYVATYNKFERQFAQFLDSADDVLRFASLGTTQQGEAGTQFKVDYLKLSGAIGFYHPDFVVVQGPKRHPVNWIVETKGRVWEGTEQKDLAMAHWCDQVRGLTGEDWRFLRVNQADFRPAEHKTFAGLLESRAGLGVPAE